MKKIVDKLYKSLYDKMNYDTFVKAKMMLLPGFRRVVTQDEAIYQNNFDQANEMFSFRKNSVSKGIDGVRHHGIPLSVPWCLEWYGICLPGS